MEFPNEPLLIFWRAVGNWGFILVIIGVIGELLATVVDHYFPRRFKKLERHWNLVEVVSGSVLIIGLAMEYGGHQRETRILDADNARLTLKAEQAGKDAAEAQLLGAKTESTNRILSLQIEMVRSKNEALEIKLIDSERKLLGLTPVGTRIASVEAFATFNTSTNAFRTNRWGNGAAGWAALLQFGRNSEASPSGFELASPDLVSDDFTVTGADRNLVVSMRFWLELNLVDDSTSNTDLKVTADDFLSNVHCFRIFPAFLFDNTEIRGGNLTLILNGSVSKTFSIPVQTISRRTHYPEAGDVSTHSEIWGFAYKQLSSQTIN